jgi:hypothetical protein
MWLKAVGGALLGLLAVTNAVTSDINCVENNNIQLCNTQRDVHVLALKSENICPENYHICNMEDKDELINFQIEQKYKSDYDLRKLKNSCYATRIASFDTRCSECRGDSIENSNMLLLGDCSRVVSDENTGLAKRFLKGTYQDVLFMTTPDVCCREPESARSACYENVNNQIRVNLQVDCMIMNIGGASWRVCDVKPNMINADCNEVSSIFPECASGFKIPLNCSSSSSKGGDTTKPSPEPTREPDVVNHPSESPKSSYEPSREPDVVNHPSESPKPSPEPTREPDVVNHPSESPKPSHKPSREHDVVNHPSESPKPSHKPSREPDVVNHPSESPKPSHKPSREHDVVNHPSESPKSSHIPVPSPSPRPEGPVCCKAMTAQCESCRLRVPLSEFCHYERDFNGCEKQIEDEKEEEKEDEMPYFCTYDDRRVPLGWFERVDECNVCKCHEGEIKCISKCEIQEDNIGEDKEETKGNDKLPPVVPPKSEREIIEEIRPNEEVMNCLNTPKHYFTYNMRSRCVITDDITGVACCANKCSVENCASCYEDVCRECMSGFNLLSYGRESRCIRIREEPVVIHNETKTETLNKTDTIDTQVTIDESDFSLDEVCEASQYMKFGRFGEVECMECIHGDVIDDKCVCHKDFYGKACEMNCRYELCSGRGKCHGRMCKCDEGYEGRSCEVKVDGVQCENGVYDEREKKCVCNYGYAGELCQREIKCYNGRIVDESCLCEEGFSGPMCNLMRPMPIRMRQKVQQTLVRQEEKQCVNGFIENERCVCMNGWKGYSCSDNICLHGRYNISTESCECRKGWTGEQCQVSCEASCSYNGDMCNDDGICVCQGGWKGSRCNAKEIVEEKSVVDVSGYQVQIERPSNETKLDVQVVECLSEECIPLKFTFERKMAIENNTALSQRTLQESDTTPARKVRIEVDEDLILENATLVMVNSQDSNVNYTTETNVVMIDSDVEGSFFVYSLVQKPDFADSISAPTAPVDETTSGTSGDSDISNTDNGLNGQGQGQDQSQEQYEDQDAENNADIDNNVLFGGAGVIFSLIVVGAVMINKQRRVLRTRQQQVNEASRLSTNTQLNITQTNPLRHDANYYRTQNGPANV